jgi:3D (Asp-Asp-Asp) domain-containing protein
MGEVGLFALLLVLVFGFGLYRPGSASVASPKHAGLALMNVQSVELAPEPVSVIDVSPATPTPAAQQPELVVPPVQADSGPPVTFDGRPLRRVRQMTMLTTAYSPDAKSCGKWADGFTASGYSVWTNGMKLVAADTRILPFGTLVSIPGYNGGRPVPVLDRGGKIKGNRLDLLYPTHDIALQWGVQRLTVDVWEYAD